MKLYLLLALGALLSAAACGGEERRGDSTAPADATGRDTERVSLTEGFSITWTAGPAPLFDGQEAPAPWADAYPDVPRENLMWRLYAADLSNAAPAAFYSTQRRLAAPLWSDDGTRLSIRYASKSAVAPNGPNIIAGILSFDASDLLSAPKDVAAQIGGLQVTGFSPSPDGRKLLLTRATSIPKPGDFLPDQGYSPPTETTLVDILTRSASKLEGVNGNASPISGNAWSPDGRYMLMYVSQPGSRPLTTPPTVDYYLVPTSNGRAVKFSSAGGFLSAAWSPSRPYKAVFVSDNGALGLLDPASGSVRKLTPDGTFAERKHPNWWSDGVHVQIGNKVVDVTTAEVTSYPPSTSDGGVFAISPDRRYMLTADNPLSETQGVCPSVSPPENHVYLYDKANDETSLVKDCDGRYFGLFDWLADGRHAVMRGFPCAACDGFPVSLVLKDIDTGRETPLTGGFEFSARPVLSPDDRKVLATGDSLRIYDEDGRLLRQIEPPPGFSVTAAAWAHDGRRFVYLVGPTDVGGN